MQTNILIVDDDREIAQAIAFYLRNEGYEPLIAADGIEALNLIRSTPVSLIIMDVMMPGLDGIQTTLRIREEHNIPIIMLSAKSEDYDKITGLNVGADDYMTKPFSTDELLARVRALTRRKGEVKETLVTFGDIILNRNNCELQKIDGETIKLSLKEFQIVELLFENPRQIIKKERIIEKIWGGDSDAEYNNVEVYISFIRKKMEQLKVNTYIRTARGIGYSLEEGK